MIKFLFGVVLLALVHGLDDDSCYSYAGGSVYPSYARGAHDLHSTKAFSEFQLICPIATSTNRIYFTVSRPAPTFEGTAVVNGEFVPLSLSDYIGKYVVFFFYPLDL